MLKQLPLHDWHKEHAAKMGPFAGFEMPIWYSSMNEEHNAIRTNVGMFDISHMGQFYFEGADALKLLELATISDISKLELNQGVYTCICNERGGVRDEAVVYKMSDSKYLMVCDASCYEKLEVWFNKIKRENKFELEIKEVTKELAFFAIQGPKAYALLDHFGIDVSELKRFSILPFTHAGKEIIFSYTGYTGEDGFEFLFSADGDFEKKIWKYFIDQGVTPCGLSARNTLRIECGFTLYEHETIERGHDGSEEETTPLECRFGWMINWDKEFIGKEALVKQKEEGLKRKLYYIEVLERGIPRDGYKVQKSGEEIGHITSGTITPLTQKGIAIAMLTTGVVKPGDEVDVIIRDKPVRARLVKLPFYDKEKYGMARKV